MGSGNDLYEPDEDSPGFFAGLVVRQVAIHAGRLKNSPLWRKKNNQKETYSCYPD